MKQKPHRGSLSERVAQQLRQQLQSLPHAGRPLPSVRSLATDMKVSVNTLRAAQRILARDGYLDIRHGQGVFPSSQALRQRIGIVCELDLFHPRTSSFYPLLIGSLRENLHRQGLLTHVYLGHVQPGETPEEPTCWKLIEDVRANRLNGLVVLTELGMRYWYPELERRKIPVVGTVSQFPARVTVDYPQLVRDGIEALLAAGCRRLAMMTWNSDTVLPVFQTALARRGLKVRDAWIRGRLHPELPGAGWEEFREIWAATHQHPDGILFTDDLLFDEAQVAIRELRIRVPMDLKVAATVNLGSRVQYPFPTLRFVLDPAHMAAALADKLTALLRGDASAATETRLTFRLTLPAAATEPPLPLPLHTRAVTTEVAP